MIPVKGYAAQNPKSPLAPFKFERRELKPHDVLIDIIYCGVCHSDIHMARDEWGGAIYPLVPGHEILGKVSRVGSSVKKFNVGDLAAVGVLVDSCRECTSCKQGLEQYCEVHWVPTYSGYEMDNKTITYGGYSNQIVTDENFVLHVSDKLDRKGIGPLLCAGITTYSPLRHWKVGKGHKIGVVGLGGLGHMGVKFAHAFCAHVVLFTTSPNKTADALRLGADEVVISKNTDEMLKHAGSFDFIIDTVSAPHDYNQYLGLLSTNGV